MSQRAAERLARAARAAQSLSEALWQALHEELGDPRAERVIELSERLVEVAATVASLARGGQEASTDLRRERSEREAHGPGSQASAQWESGRRLPGGQAPGRQTQGLRPVDEIDVEPEFARARERPAFERTGPGMERTTPDMPSPDMPTPGRAVIVDELAPRAQPEIEIKDERREHNTHEHDVREHDVREAALLDERAPSPWIDSIERRLERYERDRLPFAVLLVELADIERLRHAELPGEVARLTGLVEVALSNELRPADSLTREGPGRYWLLAPETDTPSARALAERLADAVRRAAGHRGAPLEAAVGVAVCPADGGRAVALAAHADVSLYAARAAGRQIAP